MNYVIQSPIVATAAFPTQRMPARLLSERVSRVHPRSPRSDYLVYAKGRAESLNVDRYQRGQVGRDGAEQFIRNVFYRAHGAKLKCFLPEIFQATIDDDIVAAVGLRCIDQEPIFLEQYFDAPVETLLSNLAGVALEREQIAEVGNLASHCGGSSYFLIAFLVKLLADRNISWAVCTGTNVVRAVLKRMGIEFELLQKAEPESLGEDRFDWGNYYHHNPFVLAVNVQSALKVIDKVFEVDDRTADRGQY